MKCQDSNEDLSFLEVIVHSNDCLSTRWTLKPTNTGRYIPFNSFAPMRYKKAGIRSLLHRCKRLNTFKKDYESGYAVIKSIVCRNGYPSDLVERIKHEVNFPSSSEINNEVRPTRIFWCLPYIRSTSDRR